MTFPFTDLFEGEAIFSAACSDFPPFFRENPFISSTGRSCGWLTAGRRLSLDSELLPSGVVAFFLFSGRVVFDSEAAPAGSETAGSGTVIAGLRVEAFTLSPLTGAGGGAEGIACDEACFPRRPFSA
jgi:hypothetical protein